MVYRWWVFLYPPQIKFGGVYSDPYLGLFYSVNVWIFVYNQNHLSQYSVMLTFWFDMHATLLCPPYSISTGDILFLTSFFELVSAFVHLLKVLFLMGISNNHIFKDFCFLNVKKKNIGCNFWKVRNLNAKKDNCIDDKSNISDGKTCQTINSFTVLL